MAKKKPGDGLEPFKLSTSNGPNVTKDRILQNQIEEDVVQLRIMSASYRQIADTLAKRYKRKFLPSQIKILLERGLFHTSPIEDREVAKQIHVRQLDQLILGLMPQATAGDVPSSKQVERLLAQRMKILALDEQPKMPGGGQFIEVEEKGKDILNKYVEEVEKEIQAALNVGSEEIVDDEEEL